MIDMRNKYENLIKATKKDCIEPYKQELNMLKDENRRLKNEIELLQFKPLKNTKECIKC